MSHVPGCRQFSSQLTEQTNDIKSNEKALRDANTARWLQCSKAEPKNFAAPQTPFPGAQDGQNLIADGHYFYLQTQLGEDRCMQI